MAASAKHDHGSLFDDSDSEEEEEEGRGGDGSVLAAADLLRVCPRYSYSHLLEQSPPLVCSNETVLFLEATKLRSECELESIGRGRVSDFSP